MSKKMAKAALVILGLLIALMVAVLIFLRYKLPDCMFVDPQSYKVTEFVAKGKKFFLYVHIIGLRYNRGAYYSLYDKDLAIDQCGNFSQQALLTEHVVDKKITRKIVIKKDGMQLIYRTPAEEKNSASSEPATTAHPMTQVQVEIRDAP